MCNASPFVMLSRFFASLPPSHPHPTPLHSPYRGAGENPMVGGGGRRGWAVPWLSPGKAQLTLRPPAEPCPPDGETEGM